MTLAWMQSSPSGAPQEMLSWSPSTQQGAHGDRPRGCRLRWWGAEERRALLDLRERDGVLEVLVERGHAGVRIRRVVEEAAPGPGHGGQIAGVQPRGRELRVQE